MSISLDCPRCKSNLSVPEKLAGQYAHCPKCQGRFWVPKNTAASRSSAAAKAHSTSAAAATPAASNPMPVPTGIDPMAPVRPPAAAASRVVQPPAPPIEPSARALSPPSPPGGRGATMPPAAPSADAPPTVAAPPTRRVAQFITADAAQSQLTLASDGKLPELHLSTDEKGPRKKKSFTNGPSWGMVALVVASLLMALVVVLIPGPGSDVGSSSTLGEGNRDRLRRIYFGSDAVELRPYQILLRRAQQAQDRGDLKAERQYYLEVMRMLRDENLHPRGRSLTGMIKPAADADLPNDETLEQTLAEILSEQ